MAINTVQTCLLCFALIAGCTGGRAEESAGSATSGNATDIQLSPSTFSFSVTAGDTDPMQTVDISNTGTDTLHWRANSTVTWLTLSPLSGESSQTFASAVVAKANLSSLTPGTYTGTIVVTGDDPSSTPKAISVTLTISPSLPALTSSTPGMVSPPTSFPTSPSAGLAWDEPGPAVGYYVHYGRQPSKVTGSCAYSESVYYSLSSLANPSTPTATITGLSTGTTYYFAVSAYDGTFESVCSNEIWKAM